jgi:UDP-N-acetylglucosamine 3-dehydrogenase
MRIGILGAGNMGRTHAEAYTNIPGVEIAAIVGRREAWVREVAAQFGIVASTDPWSVLDDDSIDTIDVCYPSSVHREYVVAALERGRHVFCETPIALSLEDADAMIDMAHAHDRILMVALLMRFVADNVYIHDTVVSGRLGRPLAAFANRRCAPYWSPEQLRDQIYAEPVIELGTFDFDYLNWLFGMPTAVFGTGVVGSTGAVEHAFISLEFGEDVRGLVEASAMMPRSFPFSTSVRVVCEKGALELDFRFVDGPESILTHYPKKGQAEVLNVPGHNPYEEECRYFVRCVRGEADPALLSTEAARNALRVSLAAQESLRSGGERVIP